uniref:Type III polyketide synthase n=1 Tax=Coccomyxa subellipsoidea (strain C-169) TaxID=574566 RepID=G3LY15_COCSC|nr:type III polyketide synthase [Coccomyxa subellipsoidea C-169]
MNALPTSVFLAAPTVPTPLVSDPATPYVLGTGEAYPPYSYSQDEFLEAFLERYKLDAESEDFARRIFPATQIKHGCINLPRERLFQKMTRSEFVEYIQTSTKDIAERAAKISLANWGGVRSDITHLVFGTMSAVIDSPTMDAKLIKSLGLLPTTKRISVQQMGCLTGFRCLSLATEIARSDPKARVLVVVADIRSGLQNQLPAHTAGGPMSRVTIVSCALFRDAASAAVIGGSPHMGREVPLAEVQRCASLLIPDTEDYVRIKDGDDGTISWYNKKELPDVVSAGVPTFVTDTLLQGTGLTVQDVQFIMHPGGPKILHGPAEIMGVGNEKFQASWDFLQNHGNTSGSSNLALLHVELTRPAGAVPSSHVVCIGIGPGLSLEGLLLRRITPDPAVAARRQLRMIRSNLSLERPSGWSADLPDEANHIQ